MNNKNWRDLHELYQGFDKEKKAQEEQAKAVLESRERQKERRIYLYYPMTSAAVGAVAGAIAGGIVAYLVSK